MKDYKKYLMAKTKKELVDLIAGDDINAPILTRDEPKYTRPQLLWAMNNITGEFESAEEMINKLMNELEGFEWDKFYNYNYLRFDIKKPGFYIMLGILFFALLGVITLVISIIDLF
jgi:hypothetical protein